MLMPECCNLLCKERRHRCNRTMAELAISPTSTSGSPCVDGRVWAGLVLFGCGGRGGLGPHSESSKKFKRGLGFGELALSKRVQLTAC